jgi:urea transport system permease protein
MDVQFAESKGQIVTLTIDSILAVAATVLALLGLIVTYGLLRVVNLAHGEMIAIGAYAAYMVTSHGGGLIAVCLCGFATSAVTGALIEWGVVSYFYGKGFALSILGTWGVSLAVVQILRLMFGPAGRFVTTSYAGSFSLGSSTYSVYRLMVLCICVTVLLILVAVIRSPLGLQVRAAMESSERAEAYGINTRETFRWAFIVGSGLAGLAGALLAPFSGVEPNMGGDYTTIGFVALLLTRTQRVGPSIVACALLGASRSLFAAIYDATTATLLMYTCALVALIGLPYLSSLWTQSRGIRTWQE